MQMPRRASCLRETALKQKVVAGDGEHEVAATVLNLMTDNDVEKMFLHFARCPTCIAAPVVAHKSVKLPFTYTLRTFYYDLQRECSVPVLIQVQVEGIPWFSIRVGKAWSVYHNYDGRGEQKEPNYWLWETVCLEV